MTKNAQGVKSKLPNSFRLAYLQQVNQGLKGLHKLISTGHSYKSKWYLDQHQNLLKPLGLKKTQWGGWHYTNANAKGKSQRKYLFMDGDPSAMGRVNSALRRNKIATYLATPTSLSGRTKDKPNLQKALEGIQNPRNRKYLRKNAGQFKFLAHNDLAKLRSDKVHGFQDNPKQDKHDAKLIENFSGRVQKYAGNDILKMDKLRKQYGKRFKLMDMYRANPDLKKRHDFSYKTPEQKRLISENLALDKSDGYHFNPKLSNKNQPFKVMNHNAHEIAKEVTAKEKRQKAHHEHNLGKYVKNLNNDRGKSNKIDKILKSTKYKGIKSNLSSLKQKPLHRTVSRKHGKGFGE